MKGSQEPRIQIEPSRISSDGDDATLLMSAYGCELDTWQKLVLNCWLGKDKNGKYTVTSAGLSLPRQNGKNVCLEAREFFGLVVNGEKILHTAHQVRTSKKSFRRLAAMFTDKKHPEVTDIVKNIRYTNGEECIELDNGGAIEFSARSRQAARGFDGISLVVFDEAQELMDDQVEAIMATLSASQTGTRQLIYSGTPPYPNCPGEVFRRRRSSCLANASKHDAWHEWSVEASSIEQINVEDKTLWYMCNPALGIRLDEEFTDEEKRSMSADGFARERLGWWSPTVVEHVDYAIPEETWDACRSSEPKPEGKSAYGIKFSPDGSAVCLCGAVIPEAGAARISMIEYKSTANGTQWLADWLNERYMQASCVVIDGRNGVDVLIDKIADTWRMKGSIMRPSVKDMIASVGMLTNALNEKTVTWYEKQEALRESAVTATKRPISGGWGFGGDMSLPIEACALAFFGVKTSKRNPKKKMRIG
jgi:hypothetical protein